MGTWAISIGSFVAVCLLVFAGAPTTLQYVFHIGSYDALLTGSVTFLALCVMAAGCALGVLLRKHDRGWSVYLALMPFLYVLMVVLGIGNDEP
jgi:hypothetical protein